MEHLQGNNVEIKLKKKIKYVFEYLPILIMLFVQVFISPEYISFSSRDYCSSLTQIIIVDTSVSLSFSEKLPIYSISANIYVLILIISSVLYTILQTPLFNESKVLAAYIIVFVMIIITIILKGIDGRKRSGEE